MTSVFPLQYQRSMARLLAGEMYPNPDDTDQGLPCVGGPLQGMRVRREGLAGDGVRFRVAVLTGIWQPMSATADLPPQPGVEVAIYFRGSVQFRHDTTEAGHPVSYRATFDAWLLEGPLPVVP